MGSGAGRAVAVALPNSVADWLHKIYLGKSRIVT